MIGVRWRSDRRKRWLVRPPGSLSLIRHEGAGAEPYALSETSTGSVHGFISSSDIRRHYSLVHDDSALCCLYYLIATISVGTPMVLART